MKPFTTEGDAWRFLAGEFEKSQRTFFSGTGLCAALSNLRAAGLVDNVLFTRMIDTRRSIVPTFKEYAIYSREPGGYWWPLSSVGRAERALACAFLAVLADESGVNRDTLGETFDA